MLAMSLSKPRAKALAAVITAATASVVFAGTGSQADAAGCAPTAYTPGVGGGWGIALGHVPCNGSYTIKLVNNAGNVLASSSGTGSGGVQTSNTVCAGAIVHTFIYVNVNGVGMSDTSGTVQC
jgi:hypothetical protein